MRPSSRTLRAVSGPCDSVPAAASQVVTGPAPNHTAAYSSRDRACPARIGASFSSKARLPTPTAPSSVRTSALGPPGRPGLVNPSRNEDMNSPHR